MLNIKSSLKKPEMKGLIKAYKILNKHKNAYPNGCYDQIYSYLKKTAEMLVKKETSEIYKVDVDFNLNKVLIKDGGGIVLLEAEIY